MPKLGTVIDAFNTGFQYLNKKNHRQNRWYEFWYTNDFLKNELTDVALTTGFETLALKCKKDLNILGSSYREEEFQPHQTAFADILADVLRLVQVNRSQAGVVETQNYQYSNHSIFERVLYPKKAGLFEENLINGLRTVKDQLPELTDQMNLMIEKINEAELKPRVIFHESLKTESSGKQKFSGTYMDFEVSRIKF